MTDQDKSPLKSITSGNLNELLDFDDLPSKAPRAIGGGLAVVGGFFAFIGFFFKWIGFSGLKLATDWDQTFLCCVPLLGILIMLIGLAAAAIPFLRREIRLLKPVSGGLLALLSVLLLCPIFYEFGEDAEIGWWCAPIGAVLIVVGALVSLVLPTIMEEMKK